MADERVLVTIINIAYPEEGMESRHRTTNLNFNGDGYGIADFCEEFGVACLRRRVGDPNGEYRLSGKLNEGEFEPGSVYECNKRFTLMDRSFRASKYWHYKAN